MVLNTENFDFITVQFFVSCRTIFGQNVYICGNCPQLGNWVPHQGLKLQTNRMNYPQWITSRPLVTKSNKLIQFKICIIKDDLVTWQNIPQNQYFFPGSKPTQIYLHFNSTYLESREKNITTIQCRNRTSEVIDDMESQWGSSLGRSSNYPLERFHMNKKGQNTYNKSLVSSNLISVIDSQQIQFELRILNYLKPKTLFKSMSKPPQFQMTSIKKINQNKQNTSINQKELNTGNESPAERSYRSLPKDYNKRQKNLVQKFRIFQRNSYPLISQHLIAQDKVKQNSKNAETLYSERKIISDRETVKASWISKKSNQNYENQDSQEQNYDLFGFEYF